MEGLLVASNPWGPTIVTLTLVTVVALPTLLLTRGYRKAVCRRLAITRDKEAREVLSEGLSQAWQVTAKTVVIASVVCTVTILSPAVATRTWWLVTVVLLLDMLVVWSWFTQAVPARDRERHLGPEET